jgi:hypothetical protein
MNFERLFIEKTKNNKNIYLVKPANKSNVRPDIGMVRINKFFFPVVLFCMAVLIIQPVLGSDGTITVAYRGSGGGYIGDTVIFDGLNTFGNTTLIKISGPGLPSVGVPLYDLNGAPGSGNMAEVGPDGLWKFAWYTSSIRGIEKMQTARYTITVSSLYGGSATSSTFIVMKKPELFITPSPNPVTPGSYVQLTGVAEHNVDSVNIVVTDATGKVLHSYTSPVSASGYLNYAFHVDMPPGQYTIIMSNPAMGNPFRTSLMVIPPPAITPPSQTSPGQVINKAPQSGVGGNNGSLSEAPPSPPSKKGTRTPLSSLTAIGGIIVAGVVMIHSSSSRKDE